MRVRPARCVVLLLAASPARAYAPLYADAFKRADCADVVAAVGGCPPGSWWDSVRSPDAGTSAQQLAHCCQVCPANWHTNTLSTRGDCLQPLCAGQVHEFLWARVPCVASRRGLAKLAD